MSCNALRLIFLICKHKAESPVRWNNEAVICSIPRSTQRLAPMGGSAKGKRLSESHQNTTLPHLPGGRGPGNHSEASNGAGFGAQILDAALPSAHCSGRHGKTAAGAWPSWTAPSYHDTCTTPPVPCEDHTFTQNCPYMIKCLRTPRPPV